MDNLDLTPAQYEFTAGGKEYVLREIGAEGSSKWKEARLLATSLDETGKILKVNKGAGEIELLLVSLCLSECYETKEGKKDRPATLPQIRSWPDRTVDLLYDKCIELSPTLQSKLTVEKLEEQKGKIDEQLAKLKGLKEGGKESEDSPKN